MADHDQPPPLFTYTAMTAMVAVFVAELYGSDLSMLEEFPWRLGQGQWWRLLTCTFLHASVLHIAFNIWLFYYFGKVIEDWLGPWIAMTLFVLLAAGSSAAQILIGGQQAIGVSGVVYGLFGFLWAGRGNWQGAQQVITPYVVEAMLGWLVICAIINQFGVPIANNAHIAGLALGWLLGRAISRDWRRWIFGAAGLFLCVALALCTYAPVWHKTLGRWGGNYQPNPPLDANMIFQLEHRSHLKPGLFN